jgi:hypothetical protein
LSISASAFPGRWLFFSEHRDHGIVPGTSTAGGSFFGAGDDFVFA